MRLLLPGDEYTCSLQPQILISWGWARECKAFEELFERDEGRMNLKFLGRRVGGRKRTMGVVNGCSAVSYGICMHGDARVDGAWNDERLANDDAGDMGANKTEG